MMRALTFLLILAMPGTGAAQGLEKAIITHTSESISLAPLVYGIDKGFYRQEGIDLEFRILRTDLATAAILGSKDVNYIYSAGTVVRMALRGLPVKVVAYTLKDILFYLMSQPNLRSIAELKGKKIAVALPSDTGGLATKATLKANGLDPDRDATYIAIGAASVRLAAMQAGSIDASIMPVPWNIRMKRSGFNELAFAGNYLKQPLTGFATTVERIEKNPQQVKKILRAFLRSLKAFRQEKKGAINYIAKRFGLDGHTAAESYNIVLQTLSEDGTVSRQVLQDYIEDSRKEMGIKKTFAVSDIVDFKLLQEVAKDIDAKR